MPTVLGFIIISSSVILYHSLSLVTQIYSVKAAANDLNAIETAVNTRRIIGEIDNQSNCRELPQLSYESRDAKQFHMTVNCLLLNTNNSRYNNEVRAVLSAEQISEETFVNNLTAILSAQVELTNGQNAIVTYNNQPVEMTYSDYIYIAVVESSKKEKRVLLIEKNHKISKNLFVN
ncbi:hypothetical protein RZE82_01350 [Mollicutes bacterium LVI A0039]|nr:hypothetical protein RZE82_01350 [Mollicutes bacterium LVI A0039]